MSTFNNITEDFFAGLNNYSTNPIVLFIFIVIIFLYYIIFWFLGKSDNNESKSTGMFIFEAIFWGIFIVLILINSLSYFFDINIITEIRNTFTDKPEITIKTTTKNDSISNDPSLNDVSLNLPKEIIEDKEVFHIPGNTFTYHDAKAVCKAFDSELANYEQLNESQKKGASWCSYGWTLGQLGLYPTSQSDFKRLKKKEGHEYDCGLPGVNGNFVSNSHIKLGANCFGYKPKKSELEEDYFKGKQLYPKTQKEIIFENRVNYWKDRIGNILVNPYNSEKWSRISSK